MTKTLTLLLLTLALGEAGAARTVTVSQAVQAALAHSHLLRQSQAQWDAAEAALSRSRAERWPTLSLASVANYNSEVAQLELQLPPPLNMSISRSMGDHERYQNDLRLTVPLYTGGRLGSGVAAASYASDYRRFLVESDRQDIALQACQEYYLLAGADALIAVAQASLKRTEVMLSDVQIGRAHV